LANYLNWPTVEMANTPTEAAIPDGKSSTEFKCLTSLIYITHPLVLKEIHKLTHRNLIEIKALKDGSQKWQSGDGHIDNKMTSDNIDLLYYVLLFDGPVIENNFVSDMEKTNMPASISDRKIISGEQGQTEVKTLAPGNASADGRASGEIRSTVEQNENGSKHVHASAIVKDHGKKRRVEAKVPLKSEGKDPTSKEIAEAKETAVQKVAQTLKSITAETFELGIKKINTRIEELEDKIKECSGDSCNELKTELAELKKQRINFYKYVEHQEDTMN
jgi:hypothetical protein